MRIDDYGRIAMTRDEIINSICEYIKDEKENYAVLIDGPWGSGKTYLYKNYLKEAISKLQNGKNRKEKKTNIYISLYGISSIDDLSKELITNFILYSKFNGNSVIRALHKPVDGILNILTKSFSFSVGYFSFDLSKSISRINKLIKAKNLVICFDDLERNSIPINEFFGLVNNLIEHCNCKVIVLADEDNIGKLYANTGVEAKYQTVLAGGRLIVSDSYREERKKNYNNQQKEDLSVTVDELKKMNEALFSENYIYKDVKEKVIGRTFYFRPELKETIGEVINGNPQYKIKGYIDSKEYREYLNSHISDITYYFGETSNVNLRIIKYWISKYEKIYFETKKAYETNKYYQIISDEFLRYSIWVASSVGKNKRIISCDNYYNGEYVYFEGRQYNRTLKHSFIDAWIKRDVYDEADLRKAAKSIIGKEEKEEIYGKKKRESTGIVLKKLYEWFYLCDEDVEKLQGELLNEIKADKYGYLDYANIIITLLNIRDADLLNIDIDDVLNIMIELTKKDTEVQDEDDFPKHFNSEVRAKEFDALYSPLRQERKIRNSQIDKNKAEEEDIYKNASVFCSHCTKMQEFYLSHKSFTEYISIDGIIKLVNKTDNEGIYSIRDVFAKIYYMSNVKDFFISDLFNLIELKNALSDGEIIPIKGKTHQYAINCLKDFIVSVLVSLGYEE